MDISHTKPTLNIARTFQQHHFELTLPSVPAAIYDEDHEGLLPLSALALPLRVELVTWLAATADDTYQLLWNNVSIGVPKIITTEQPGDLLFLELPTQFLDVEGTHDIAYRAVNVKNNFREDSLPVRIEIDLTPPGRPQLGPMKFPDEVEGGLTSDELTELGDQLVVEIGGYTGMYQHDEIKTYWGDIEGPGVMVNRTDMGLNRVMITYTRAFLESLFDFDGLVAYTVTDRAGNLSEVSLGTHVQLLLSDAPDDLPAPIIDPAVGDLIDFSEARSGIAVDIPNYPDVEAFDQVTLYWEGIPSAPQVVPDGNENAPVVLSFTVPYPTIAVKPEGVAHVTYAVQKAGQPFGTSQEASIDVFVSLPGPNLLDAPVVQGSSISNPNTDDNFIDEDDYELNSRAIINWKIGFALSDELNLHWGNESITQWYQIKASDISAQRDLILPIPNETMKDQGTGAQIPVFYSLTRLGNPNPNFSPVQDVIVRSSDEMPGGINGPDGPTFNTTAEGTVGPIENAEGAVVTIVPYLNIQEGQTLEFTFKGFSSNGTAIPEADFADERTLDRNDIINGYTFTVPVSNLKRICVGIADAYFKVIPAAGSNQSAATSRTTRVPVNMAKPSSQCSWVVAAAH